MHRTFLLSMFDQTLDREVLRVIGGQVPAERGMKEEFVCTESKSGRASLPLRAPLPA